METAELLKELSTGGIGNMEMPDLNFEHIQNLTDRTGIFQHAVYHMPNLKEGYCIDDNSRALLLMILAGKGNNNPVAKQLLPVYLSFIHYMQTDNGRFRNFMLFDKTCPEEFGSEDSFGRTMMALGYLVNEGAPPMLVRAGKEIFARSAGHIENLKSLRGMANSIVGLCKFVSGNYPDDLNKEIVVELADKLKTEFNQSRGQNWYWFESNLSYDNAILPLAMLHAFELTGDKSYFMVAGEAMDFLESIVLRDSFFRPVGNGGWMNRNGKPAFFDQQGIDTMAMILYYQQAYKLTGDEIYKTRLITCYNWFLGANDLGLALYDVETGGCSDGLQPDGINYNQGAESTLAYWISHMIVAEVLEK